MVDRENLRLLVDHHHKLAIAIQGSRRHPKRISCGRGASSEQDAGGNGEVELTRPELLG